MPDCASLTDNGIDGFENEEDEVVVRSGDGALPRWLAGFERAADPSLLPLGRHAPATGTYTQWQRGLLSIADFDGGAFHRSAEVAAPRVQEILRPDRFVAWATDDTPDAEDLPRAAAKWFARTPR